MRVPSSKHKMVQRINAVLHDIPTKTLFPALMMITAVLLAQMLKWMSSRMLSVLMESVMITLPV